MDGMTRAPDGEVVKDLVTFFISKAASDGTFTCPVCFEGYSDRVKPTTLPCGHSLCLGDAKKLDPRQCPICSQSFSRANLTPSFSLLESAMLFEQLRCSIVYGVAHAVPSAATRPVEPSIVGTQSSRDSRHGWLGSLFRGRRHTTHHEHEREEAPSLFLTNVLNRHQHQYENVEEQRPTAQEQQRPIVQEQPPIQHRQPTRTRPPSPVRPPALRQPPAAPRVRRRVEPVAPPPAALLVTSRRASLRANRVLSNAPVKACGCQCTCNTEYCCEHMDRRPYKPEGTYPVFLDGRGFVERGMRAQHYCPECKDRLL